MSTIQYYIGNNVYNFDEPHMGKNDRHGTYSEMVTDRFAAQNTWKKTIKN